MWGEMLLLASRMSTMTESLGRLAAKHLTGGKLAEATGTRVETGGDWKNGCLIAPPARSLWKLQVLPDEENGVDRCVSWPHTVGEGMSTMITMGLRAAPKLVTFVIFDSVKNEILNVEDIQIPAAFEWPVALKYVRSSVLDVLREYDVARAGIRTSEPMAKSLSSERIQIEGVVQEAFASSSLQGYFAGPIAVGAAMLRIERASFKPMTKEGRNDMEVDGWEDMSEVRREAVLYAMGAANA